MMKIFKYALPPFGKFSLEVPKDAIFLDFKAQNNMPVIWVYVDGEQKEKETRNFVCYATGEDIPYGDRVNAIYLGTALFTNDTLVTHLFELE